MATSPVTLLVDPVTGSTDIIELAPGVVVAVDQLGFDPRTDIAHWDRMSPVARQRRLAQLIAQRAELTDEEPEG